MNQQNWEPLRTLYPAWRIRPSANDRCLVATRLDRFGLTPAELYAGLHMTLIEDTPERLSYALSVQTAIEGTL